VLIFPEVLSKEEVEDLNQMAEEVERFFKEKGWFVSPDLLGGMEGNTLISCLTVYSLCLTVD